MTASTSATNVESPTNIPMARFAHTWTPLNSSNGFLMFGGTTLASGYLNDIWRFNVTTRNWAWIIGSATTGNQAAIRGTVGVSGPANVPAGTYGAEADMAYGTDKMYMFAGNSGSLINELWMFDFTIRQWTYLSSSAMAGNFMLNSQYPGARRYFSVVTIPNTPLLAMLNGDGYSLQGHVYGLSEIWVLNTTSNKWSWIRGESSTTDIGSYGQMGVTSSLSLPPRRYIESASWAPKRNQLVLFGGYVYENSAYSYRDDVWYIDFGVNNSNSMTAAITSNAVPSTTVITSSKITSTTGSNPSTTAVTTSLTITGTTGSNPLTTAVTTLSSKINAVTSSFIGATSSSSFTIVPAASVVSSGSSTSRTTTTPLVASFTSAFVPRPTVTSAQSKDPYSFIGAIKPYAILIGIVFGCIVVLTIAFCVWRRREKAYQLRERQYLGKDSTAMSAISGSSSSYSNNTATMSSMNQSTMMNNQTEFAIPAFLRYKAGAEFRWRQRIAVGGGGEVYIGDALIPKLAEFGPTIIIKIVGPSRAELPMRTARAFDQELSVMHYLGRHQNIAGLLGWCDEPMAMLMKFYPLGSLDKVVANGDVFNKSLRVCFLLDIARGVSYMHSKGVAHCDLKPANVLVDQNQYGQYFCVLTDFGISQLYSQNANLVYAFTVVNVRGASIAYAAPEVVSRFRRGEDATQSMAFAGDIYSLGMIASSLLLSHDGWYQ